MNLNSWQTHILYIFSTYSLASWGQAKRTNMKRALDKAIFIKISFRWAAKAVSSGSWTATWEMWKGHGEWWQRWSIVIGHVETEVMVKFVNHERKWTKNQRNTSPLVLRLFQIGWRRLESGTASDVAETIWTCLVSRHLSCRVLQLAQLASWITRSSCGRLMDSWQKADRMRTECEGKSTKFSWNVFLKISMFSFCDSGPMGWFSFSPSTYSILFYLSPWGLSFSEFDTSTLSKLPSYHQWLIN